MTHAAKRILYVEDNPSDVLLVQIAWEEAGGGAEFIVATDCAAAVAHLARGPADPSVPPDLILLDLNLPGCHGLDVLRYVTDRHLDVPVIVLTTSADPRDRHASLSLGAADYHVKPDSLDALIALARQLRGELLARPGS